LHHVKPTTSPAAQLLARSLTWMIPRVKVTPTWPGQSRVEANFAIFPLLILSPSIMSWSRIWAGIERSPRWLWAGANPYKTVHRQPWISSANYQRTSDPPPPFEPNCYHGKHEEVARELYVLFLDPEVHRGSRSMPIEFEKEKSPPSPRHAAATRALSISQGAPSRARGSCLPLYLAGGPPDSTKVGHLGAEKEDVVTSPSHYLLVTS
jgi:hypothetical protein